ncbi:MAG TPA: hypothetical protein VMM36_12370 [Opitutaceae bacterium]|nr:hypothetical protein [Opitutaceae bacterium]
MRRPILVTLFLLHILAIAVPATAMLKEAAMRLPAELATVERVPVKGRQGWKLVERVQFGDCDVYEVRRSFTKGGDLRVGRVVFYEGSKRRQTFGFTLAGPDGAVWHGGAATNVRRHALDHDGFEIALRDRSGFMARLEPDAAPDDGWTLDLTETFDRPLKGTLKRGERTITVTGTNKLAATPLPLDETTGYVFESGGKPVAAVEVINNGAVWISSTIDASDRAPVTAAIAALLLFEELRKTLPE